MAGRKPSADHAILDRSRATSLGPILASSSMMRDMEVAESRSTAAPSGCGLKLFE